MRIAAWPVYIAFVSAACRAEVILDDGRPDGAAGNAGNAGDGSGGAAGRGAGGSSGRGGYGAGGNGRGGAIGSGSQDEGGLGSGGHAGTSNDDASTLGSGGSGAPTDDAGTEGGPIWPGPPPPPLDAGPDGCMSVGPAPTKPVVAQCDGFAYSHYDALRKSVVLASPYLPPGVGGAYSLTYTLATPSGAHYVSSSGLIEIVNGWMVIDLSRAPDVDRFPIINIAICSITYTDWCGVTHRYSDEQFIEDQGCARLILLPNADSGVELVPECVAGDCREGC